MIHASNGPNWDEVVGMEYRNCRKNWLYNLLYINNLVDYKNMVRLNEKMAMIDVQLFLFAVHATHVVHSN